MNQMAALSGSQIYKPDEVHPLPIQFAIFFILWQPNGMASNSQLTNQMTPPHPVHPVNNLWTGRQAVRFSNFKKGEPDDLVQASYQKLQNCLIKEGYLDNFFKDSYGIKILYGGAGREYGVEEEFVIFNGLV